MKYLITILLISSQVLSQNFETNNLISKTIITNSELKETGIINISDILTQLNNWNISTINGYSYSVSPNNLSLHQNLIVSIDGQQINLGENEFINLNLIPLTIDQIDTVEVISFPQLYIGQYTQGGMINFITKKPTKGLSLNIFNSVGNEVGDPGPYVYTQERSPNVDKLGYLLSFNLNTRGENWYLRTFIKKEENYLTDPAIKDRISNVSSNFKSNILAASSILNFNALNGNHNFLFGYTENDDFIFVRKIGYEIPIDKKLKHFGLNGTFELTENINLNYFIKHSENQLENALSDSQSSLIKRDKLIHTRFESEYKNKNILTTFGLIFENRDITLQDYKNKFNRATLFSSISYFLTQDINYVLDFSTTKQNEKTLFNGTLRNLWKITPNNNISLAFSFSQDLFTDNLSNYSNLYSPFSKIKNEFINSIQSDNINNLFSSDLSYSSNINQNLKVSIVGNYRHFFNTTLEDYNYQFNNINNQIESNYFIKYNEFLKVLSGSIEIGHIISEVVNHKLYYGYQSDFEGSHLYRELWQSFPNHKLVYSINFNFNNSFGLWAKYYFHSETEWTQYRYLDYQSENKSSNKIDAYSNIDLSVQKWFWQKRVWLNLVFKNLLNNTQYFHPIGAGFDMRFYLQLHVYFHSILI